MHLVRSSDQTLLIRDCADALALFHTLQGRLLSGVTGLSPARGSVMVRFDARVLDHAEVENWVAGVEPVEGGPNSGRLIEIPTLYIGDDLDELAASRGMSPSDVVEIHSGCEYVAWFLGFVPGFAYLGDVPDSIAAPRRNVPRREVPPGSVGIAGKQTGIYPRATPGGWNLIGRTEVSLFDAVQGKSLIEPGDRVRFVPV